jgi:hypothetical protein
MNRRLAVSGALLVGLLGSPARAAGEAPAAFVQRFYDSYLKRDAPDWARTVRNGHQLFDRALANALLEDAAAQSKSTGDIVGIDFDPFLGSQDPGNKFRVGRAVATATGYRVEVFDQEAGPNGKPVVLDDLATNGENWIITDFRYPNTSSELLSTLQSLRESRRAASFRHR